jgi:putative addiction module component (TIGR02574 family)
MSVDAILKEVEALSAEERAELMRRLLEQYSWQDGWLELSDEMKELLDQRNAAADANPDDALTWEQVVEYVKRKK